MRWADELDGDDTGCVSSVEVPVAAFAPLVQPQPVPLFFDGQWQMYQPQTHPASLFFLDTPFGIELQLDGRTFLITETAAETKRLDYQLQQSHPGISKEGKKALSKISRMRRFDALKFALEACPCACKDKIIEQAFSEAWLSKFWEDDSGNYFVQHLISIAAAEQVECPIRHLVKNFDALLKKRNAFAGRYIERLSERSDFLDLLKSSTCSLNILLRRIGKQAAAWAAHRDGNYALGALLQQAPVWFAFEIHSQLKLKENFSGNHASVRIVLEKAEARVGMRRTSVALTPKRCCLEFVDVMPSRRTRRRTQSTADLNQ